MIFDSLFFYSLFGVSMVAWCCGLLSPFVYTRRQSLLADAMSHAAFLGVPLGFYVALMFFGNFLIIHPFIVIFAAFLATALGLFCQFFILEKTHFQSETVLSLLLAGFFSFGVLAFNFLEQNFGELSAKLSTFLYGNAASLAKIDFLPLIFFTFIITFSVFCWQKYFCLVSFQSNYAFHLRYSSRKWILFLDFLILFMICVGLQIMGALLMGILLVAPAAAAKFWVKRFSSLIILSTFFALIASWIGVFFSTVYKKVPTGPSVALVSIFLVLVSLSLHWKIFFKKNRVGKEKI